MLVQMVGGPLDGLEVEVPQGAQEVLVPLVSLAPLDWSGFNGDAEPPVSEIPVGRYRWRRDKFWPYRAPKFVYEGPL
jgi:hypothetical protein